MERVVELRAIPLFKAVGADALVPVAAIATHVQFARDATIFEQGEGGDCLYVISDGEVAIIRDDVELARLGKGECFGEMALLEQAPRSATARAATDSMLLTIARDDFKDLLDVYPVIARAIANVLVERLRDAYTRAPESDP